MQLGSRFSLGESPRGVSESFVGRLRAAELDLTEDEVATVRWTLTWLENRPIATLDTGTKVTE